MGDQADAAGPGAWPIDGGELGRRIREHDWRGHPLGLPDDWSPALRGAVELILPATVQIVMFWGPDYRAFYNDTYAPTIGDKHPHALGEPAEQYWGELWSDLGPLLDGVRTTGQTFTARDRPFQINRRGFMEEVFFDVSYSAIRDPADGVGGVLCIVRETTGQVRALEHLELAQAVGGAGVFEMFLDTGDIDVSDGYRRLYGLEPGAPAGVARLVELMHPDDRPMATPVRVGRRESPIDYIEYRIHRADTGEERWLARRGDTVDEPGRTRRFVGVTVDITDRKRAEEALRQLNENLEDEVAERTRERDRMWRHSRDLMLVIGADGVIHAANPAWSRILGRDPSKLVGRPRSDTIAPFAPGALESAFGDALEQGLSDYEIDMAHEDGRARRISWTTVTDDRGEVYAYGRDVTEERAAAEALARTEDQLRQAQKMEAVGQLTGGIAHDFNNLLQGITGALDLIRKRMSEGRIADTERFIAAAMTSAERASALTHRLLAFSRRQPLDPRPLKVNPLVATMEDMLRRTLGESITLELVLAGGLWMTLCDANQLENAILNLAINARDAMPDGGKLTIETCNAHLDNAYVARERDVAQGQYVCISVSDTGAGMTPEVIARAFDPFFTTKPIGQGTGLGLSMIYGFARQSEGSIKLYSEVGQGTTAKIYLPRYRGPAPEPDQVDAFESAGGAEETVLVVEDEAVVRTLIIEVLKELGYRTLQAADGLEGLQILKSDRRIDLLVTDIGLPGLNGRMMAEAARKERPGLKVLFMTGYAENAAKAAGFLEPGMQMLTKPFAMDALARRVEEMVNKG